MSIMQDLKDINIRASEVAKEVLATDDETTILVLITQLANEAYEKGTKADGRK